MKTVLRYYKLSELKLKLKCSNVQSPTRKAWGRLHLAVKFSCAQFLSTLPDRNYPAGMQIFF